MKLKPSLLLTFVLTVALFFPTLRSFAEFTVEGNVFEADGKTLVPDDTVGVVASSQDQAGNNIFALATATKGAYSATFTQDLSAGKNVAVITHKVGDFGVTYSLLPVSITLSANDVAAKKLKVDLATNRISKLTVKGKFVDANKSGVPNTAISILTETATTKADGSYEIVFDDYATNPFTGDKLKATASVSGKSFSSAEITLSSADLTKREVILDVSTEGVLQFTISGSVFSLNGSGLANAKVSAKGKETTTKSDGKYEIILTDLATNPSVGDKLTITVQHTNLQGQVETRTYTETVVDKAKLVRNIVFLPAKTSIGGLSVNTQNYVELVNLVIAESFKHVTDPILKQPAVQQQLVDQLLAPQIRNFLPIYPNAPKVIQAVEGILPENFGNSILPPLGGLANAGLISNQAFLPAKATGNKLDLFLILPKAGASKVDLELVGQSTSIKAETKQLTESSKDAAKYEFQLEEEIALLLLPAYPNLGGANPQPVLSNVTLMLASGVRPPARRSDYSAIPMTNQLIDGKPVWTAAAKVEASKSYFYFYELNLRNPINLYGTAFRTSKTKFIIPDPRNLQIEDRGLIERLAPAIGSVINQVDLGQVSSNPTAVVNDLLPKLTAALNVKAQEILAEAVANLDPMVVSRFFAPAVPNPADGSLWSAHFDLKGAADGNYEVKGKVSGAFEENISKSVIIDRTAAASGTLTVGKGRDSAVYQDKDGSYIAYGKSEVATVKLSAKFDKSDAVGAIVEVMEYSEDPSVQAQKVWMPVNPSVALAVAIGKIIDPKMSDQLSQYPTLQSLIDLSIRLEKATAEELSRAVAKLQPETVKSLLGRFQSLDQKKVDNVIALVSQFVANPTNAAPLLALATLDNFSLIQAFFGLENEIPLSPGFLGTSGSVEALIPIIGKFWVRAVAFDDVFNVETTVKPTLIEVVKAEFDKAEVVRASVGDRNGDGDDDDLEFLESGPADGFAIYADDVNLDLIAKITTRSRHPLLSVVFQYAGSDKKWVDIGKGKEQADGSWTISWKIDFASLSAQGKAIKVRAVASNALELSDPAPQEANMTVDDGVRPLAPVVLKFRLTASSFSIDSGAPKGTIKLEALTASRTGPETQNVVFQISSDGGKTWSNLTEDKGGVAGGSIALKDAKETKEDSKSFRSWTLNWDSAKVADTITKNDPSARDQIKDTKPYQLRALTGYEIERNLTLDPKLVQKTSIDNIDDVPPLSGTAITQIISKETGLPIAPQADGSFKLSDGLRFEIAPKADPKTFSKVFLKFDKGISPIEAKLEGGIYIVELETITPEGKRIYPNGRYIAQALAIDDQKNEEVVADLTLAKQLLLANPEIPVLGDIAATTQNQPPQTVSKVTKIYVSRTANFKLKAQNFKDLDLLISATDDVSLKSPSLGKANFKVSAVGDEVTIDWNTILWQENSGSPDGTYYLGIKLIGSTVLEKIPVPVVVDNTPPVLTVVAPVEGHNVGVRPTIWATYSDTTAGIDETKDVVLELLQPDRKPFDSAKIAKENRKEESIYNLISGEILQVGTYIAKVKVVDRSGNLTSIERRFVTEADLPTVVILSPAPGETVGVRPTISAIYSGPLAIDTAKVKFTVAAPGGKVIDVAGKKVLGTEVTLAPGEDTAKVKFTLKEPDVPGRKLLDAEVSFTPKEDLADGEYTATIEVTDASGALAKASRFFIVKSPPPPPPPPPKDTVAPTIVFLSPRADAPVGAKPTILVTYSDSKPGINVKSVEMKLDGAVVKADADVGRAVFTPAAALKGGAHKVDLSVADLDGNKATASWEFTVEVIVDTTPPQITVVSPQGGATVGAKPTISVAYSDDMSEIDPNSVKVSLDGADIAAEKTKTQASFTPKDNLKPGVHTVKVEVADASKNSASLTWSFNVEVDTTSPQITVVSPTGTIIELKPKISAAFSDTGSGVASVKLSVDEGAGGEKNASAAEISVGLIDFVPAANLSPGVHSVGISVTDKAGNTGQARWSFTIAVDKTPPIISNVSPQGGSLLGSRKVDIVAAFTDDLSGVDKVTLSLDGKDTGAKATAESVSHTADNLSVGDHSVALRVIDKSGNTAVAQWNFAIESVPPVVSIVSPQAESKTTEKRIVISANYADNLAGVDGASIKLIVDKEDVSSKASKSSTQISYTPEKDFEVGRHSVRLEVSDKVGNKTVQDWSFLVEEVFGGIVDAHNFPNPFSVSTKIAFVLPRSAEVSIRIFDFSGRLVRELLKSNEEAGRKAVEWNGKTETGDDLANGVYFAQIIVKSDFEVKSAVVKLALSRK